METQLFRDPELLGAVAGVIILGSALLFTWV
jgi:hypothetical protein